MDIDIDDVLKVEPYDPVILPELFSINSQSDADFIKYKYQSNTFFRNYFNELNAKTVVVEQQYTDKDFMEDYATYYSRCFDNKYASSCGRLHFFSDIEFNQEDFLLFISSSDSQNEKLSHQLLQQHYLGFIVVKPLPETIIGRTCLVTYDDDNGRRHFPIIRSYHVSLFGIELEVRSLAFQEQDKVAAACATSAIWSAFHGTGILFHHTIPSPIEITNKASVYSPLETRSLPNDGLTISQMAHAIISVGLEPYLVPQPIISDDAVFKGTIYAYLKCGLPILFAIKLYLEDKCTFLKPCKKEDKGGHAVTITGYSLGAQSTSNPDNGLLLKSSSIDAIYVHDDQVGPFAKMKFLDNSELTTSFSFRNENNRTTIAKIDRCLVPLYHKIRIPYVNIHNAILGFNTFIERYRRFGESFPPNNSLFEWDIYLTTVNQFKSEISKCTILDKDKRKKILLQPMPKFIWRASAIANSNMYLDILFDATDIEQGLFGVCVIGYEKDFFDFFEGIFQRSTADSFNHWKHEDAWKVIHWFIRQYNKQ